MASKEELVKIKVLAEELARKVGFNDLNLSIENDQTGTIKYIGATYSLKKE